MKRFLTLFAVVALVVAMAVPAFADGMTAEDYGIPITSSVWTDVVSYPYAIIKDDYENGIRLYLLSKKPYGNPANGNLTFDAGASVPYMRYDFVDGEWGNPYPGGASFSFRSGDLIWSSDDIYIGSDIVFAHNPSFFPLPLWAEMGLVMQGEMQGLTQTTGGTMKVLTLCGVGLIALLVVLSLFGKRSLISRG